jgi:transcriptional regulator with XRE-family HTH domain
MAKTSKIAALTRDADKGSHHADTIDMHIGGRVRARRVLLGMSRAKLGDRLHVAPQQIQKYEKGINSITASRLFDLAKVLGVTVQFFYEGAPTSKSNPAPRFARKGDSQHVVNFLRSKDGAELNSAFGKITNPRTRRAIVGLVRSLTAPSKRVKTNVTGAL